MLVLERYLRRKPAITSQASMIKWRPSASKTESCACICKQDPCVCIEGQNVNATPVPADELNSSLATIADLQRVHYCTDKQISSLIEKARLENSALQDELTKLRLALAKLQDDYSDQVATVKDLKYATYNGEFIWKVCAIERKIKATRDGKLLSLYSPPFFTSQSGYKMCLQLYLDGKDYGKGTHISLYMIIMRGMFDDLLNWPFQKVVTMILLSQDNKEDITRPFSPRPFPNCFQKPKKEMNVPSGFTDFAPISLLKNPSYNKNDSIFIKVIVENSGVGEHNLIMRT